MWVKLAISSLWGWVILGCLLADSAAKGAADGVINKEVQRKIDISTQLAKVSTTYTVNGASGTYKVAIPLLHYEHLAFLEVSVQGKAVPFQVEETMESKGVVVYSVGVGEPGNGAQITVKSVYTDVLSPYPKEITQKEEQAVVYESLMFAPSPYKTSKLSTTVKLASSEIIDATEMPGKRVVKRDIVTYGPFGDVEAFDAGGELRVHYVNHAPFAKVTSCLREIEISNWGFIAVEEHYDMVHAGARLKGGFSRMDYLSLKHRSVPNPSFRELEAVLPHGASDIYYRDNIGNVSTSTVERSLDGVELTISTRFPMYGGWKTAWYQGYNLPTQAGLRHAGSHFTLEVPFGPPFNSIWVDDLTVKVILPEGAHNIVVVPPFESVTEARTQRFTYLDMPGAGRPVIILRMRNVVQEHNLKLKVSYDFNRLRMLVEPLLIAGFFLACFLVAMLVRRIDMRIRKGSGQVQATAG